VFANSLEEPAAAAAVRHDSGLGKRWNYIGRDGDQIIVRMEAGQ